MSNRTSNSVKNSVTGVVSNLINIILNFFAQKIFIGILGIEYLGFNGLFNNILSFLNIAELGIGEAIIFHMYKPIAEKDKEKIKTLMQFYKKAYRYITLVILIIGLSITPFIKLFVGESQVNMNVYIVYILFLFQIISSYILTYRRSILYANQHNYIINIIHMSYLIMLNIIQLYILYITRNYYLYLIIKIILQVFENIIINIYTNKKYSYLNEKNVKKIDNELNDDIFKRIRAQSLHKIGGFVVNGTDNILISKLINIATVGLYSNYYLIIGAVTNLFSQFISASTASLGNLLLEKDTNKNYSIFNKIRFLNFYLSVFTGTCIFMMIQDFVIVWLGEKYLLSHGVLVVLVINFYQKMMRKTYDSFLNAAGICVENKFVPIVEAILNIIASILLFNFFGLSGIFMGTIISGLALWGYSYPKFMYKKILMRNYKQYVIETIRYFFIFVFIFTITYFIGYLIKSNNIYLDLMIKMVISIICPNIILYILYHNKVEYKYFIGLIKKIFNKMLKR